jgi:ATP-binding cassette subfamily B protein
LFAVLGCLGYYAAYVFIIMKAVAGDLSIGSLTFLAVHSGKCGGCWKAFLHALRPYRKALSTCAIFSIFSKFSHVLNRPCIHAFSKSDRSGLTFEDVGFRYGHADRWANRHLNFTLKG